MKKKNQCIIDVDDNFYAACNSDRCCFYEARKDQLGGCKFTGENWPCKNTEARKNAAMTLINKLRKKFKV